MEITTNSSNVIVLDKKYAKTITDKASEILNDKGSNRITPISAKIIYADDKIITVDYIGEDKDKVKYSQTVDFYREKNMQYIY